MPLDAAGKMRAYRKRLRKRGLRPVQLWVPDTRSAPFAAAARRQSRLIANDPAEREILAFIDVAADMRGWK
jgi:hypothetical protein